MSAFEFSPNYSFHFLSCQCAENTLFTAQLQQTFDFCLFEAINKTISDGCGDIKSGWKSAWPFKIWLLTTDPYSDLQIIIIPHYIFSTCSYNMYTCRTNHRITKDFFFFYSKYSWPSVGFHKRNKEREADRALNSTPWVIWILDLHKLF